VVLVTHEPDEAMRMADEIALMRGGADRAARRALQRLQRPGGQGGSGFLQRYQRDPGRVAGALTETPFGAFLTPGHADGAEVEIVIRPQHLKIDFDRAGRGPNPTPQDGTPARGVVTRARYLGRESLVDFRMDLDGSKLTASCRGCSCRARARRCG
jgi:iron(III) transport system ATP-binding protein